MQTQQTWQDTASPEQQPVVTDEPGSGWQDIWEARKTPTDVRAQSLAEDGNASPLSLQLEFSGSGKEYFRIWIVNLCLTLLTFGIYSAWAKVRRLQYFDRNTWLAGSSFHFHGKPLTILRGRLVAVFLLFCYHYLFNYSAVLATGIAAAFLFLIPLMMRGALRFRLSNTSYRGLRLTFDGPVWPAFVSFLPMVALFILPPLAHVLYPGGYKLLLITVGFGFLCWPVIQASIKRYQLNYFGIGQLHSECKLGLMGFVSPYLGMVLLMLLVVIFLFMLIAGSAFFVLKGKPQFAGALSFLGFSIVVPLSLSFLWPVVQVKVWNRQWAATTLRFPLALSAAAETGEREQLRPLAIHSALPAFAYARLQFKNMLLTVLTLGLYRPFAIVATYRFRLAHTRIDAFELEKLSAARASGQNGAAGEGAADFFGFDLSW